MTDEQPPKKGSRGDLTASRRRGPHEAAPVAVNSVSQKHSLDNPTFPLHPVGNEIATTREARSTAKSRKYKNAFPSFFGLNLLISNKAPKEMLGICLENIWTKKLRNS
jgi:hypothetical protein